MGTNLTRLNEFGQCMIFGQICKILAQVVSERNGALSGTYSAE
jgi:hypothetical protein